METETTGQSPVERVVKRLVNKDKKAGTPLRKAKRPGQAAKGIAFVGVAAARQSHGGLQYLVFAADMETLRKAWADVGATILDEAMAKTVTIFERHEPPNVVLTGAPR